jgi:hypothetical protein
MWNVFASEDWDIAICAVYVFLYTTNPIEWDKSVKFQGQWGRNMYIPILFFCSFHHSACSSF